MKTLVWSSDGSATQQVTTEVAVKHSISLSAETSLVGCDIREVCTLDCATRLSEIIQGQRLDFILG